MLRKWQGMVEQGFCPTRLTLAALQSLQSQRKPSHTCSSRVVKAFLTKARQCSIRKSQTIVVYHIVCDVQIDRNSTRLNSSHQIISYAVSYSQNKKSIHTC